MLSYFRQEDWGEQVSWNPDALSESTIRISDPNLLTDSQIRIWQFGFKFG